MSSQAAVNDPSSRRSSSRESQSHSERRGSHQLGAGFGTLDFAHTHTDGSPHRASASSFDADIINLQLRDGDTLDGGGLTPTAEHTTTDHQLLNGVDHDSCQTRTPPRTATTSRTRLDHPGQRSLSNHITPPDFLPDGLGDAPPSDHPIASALAPSTSGERLSSPSHPQHPTTELRSSAGPNLSDAQQTNPPNSPSPHRPSSTIQQVTSLTSQQQQQQPPPPRSLRNRRRRRFARWLRRRFRLQMPWLEGWLHRRGGSERREARRAIRMVDEAFP